MKKFANISGILIAFVLLGWVTENLEEFKWIKTRMQMPTIPVKMIGRAKTGKILKRLGLLHVVPNDYQYYRIPSKKDKNPAHKIFKQKRSVGIQLYSIDKNLIGPDRTPSSAVIPMNEIASGLPILSLVLDENDLYDSEIGIIPNRLKKGRKWERTAYLSYFEKARLLFSTGVGVRIHGGTSRRWKEPNFRLYFRELHGADQFKPGILFDRSSDPLKCLIIRRIRLAPSARKIVLYPFAEPIALELAGQIGCVVPKTKIIKLFINGKYKGIYSLWERIDTDYLQSHYGHKNFILARTKRIGVIDPVKHGPKKPYHEFKSWARNLKRPVSMQLVSQRVNLENLCNWIISVMFCETADAFQGSLIFDLSDPQAKWFWINWDMQWSFIPISQWRQVLRGDNTDYFTYLFNVKDIRAILFKALIEDSADFRKYFNVYFEEVMQSRLNSQYIESLLDRYDQLIKSFGVDDSSSIKKIHQFILERDHFLRKKIQQYFNNTEYNKIASELR